MQRWGDKRPIIGTALVLPVSVVMGLIYAFTMQDISVACFCRAEATQKPLRGGVPQNITRAINKFVRETRARFKVTREADTQVDRLLQQTMSGDPDVRTRAYWRFKEWGRPALPRLVEKLAASDRRIRDAALHALAGIVDKEKDEGKRDPAFTPILIRSMRDADDRLRARATMVLRWLYYDGAVPEFERALKDDCLMVQYHAAMGLAELGYLHKVPAAFVQKLLEAGRSSSEHGGLGNPFDPQNPVPSDLLTQIEGALQRIEQQHPIIPKVETQIDRVIRQLANSRKEDKQPCVAWFQEIGKAAVPRLVYWLAYPYDNPNWQTGRFRIAAMQGLTAIAQKQEGKPDPDLVPIILRSLHDRDLSVAAQAMEILRRLRPPELVPEFEKWLRHPQFLLRYHAAKALVELGHKDKVPPAILEEIEKSPAPTGEDE